MQNTQEKTQLWKEGPGKTMSVSFAEVFFGFVKRYRENPTNTRLLELVACLFEGIEKDCRLACIVGEGEGENGEVFLQKYSRKDEGEMWSPALCSMADEEKPPRIADIRLRSLAKLVVQSDECEGLLIDPGENTIYIPKALIRNALSAGQRMFQEN